MPVTKPQNFPKFPKHKNVTQPSPKISPIQQKCDPTWCLVVVGRRRTTMAWARRGRSVATPCRGTRPLPAKQGESLTSSGSYLPSVSSKCFRMANNKQNVRASLKGRNMYICCLPVDNLQKCSLEACVLISRLTAERQSIATGFYPSYQLGLLFEG